MSLLAKNLKALRLKSGLTQQEIADLVGITDKNWSSYERGRTQPDVDTLVKMANVFKVSTDALITRDVSLIAKDLIAKMQEDASPNASLNASLNPKKSTFTPSIGMPKIVTVDVSGAENVVLVPVRAQAGYLSGYQDVEFIQNLPSYRMPGLNHGSFRMFEVYGHSMVPTFHESDIVIGRYVESWAEIRDERVYVVVTRRDGVVIKRVVNRIQKEGKLILNSDNQRHQGEYPPIVVDPDEVLEIWYVRRYLSSQMAKPGEIYNRVTDLESRLTLLEEREKKRLK